MKSFKQHFNEKKSDYEFIADQLSNNENPSDKELTDHLSKETGIDKKKISNLVKKERTKFMNSTLDISKAVEIIKQNLKESVLSENFISSTYGVVPKINDFKKHLENDIDDDTGMPWLAKGKKYPYTLRGSDADTAREIGISASGNLNIKALHKMISTLTDAWDNGNDNAGDIASSMMQTLGYEWI